jgi:hypothetical protein
MKLAVVVEITPFVFEVSTKELVVVDMLRVLFVMIEEVATDPPMFEVRVLADATSVVGTERLVMVALFATMEFSTTLSVKA